MAVDVDVDSVMLSYRARQAACRAASAERATALRSEAARVAARLAAELGAKRVWLFGSLAWGLPHEDSDVDLLVEGAAPQSWSRACAIAESIVTGPVDVVFVDDAPPELVDRVRAEGVLLHDAG